MRAWHFLRIRNLLLVSTLLSTPSLAQVDGDIERLIEQVTSSPCSFIRNGKRHSPQEAVLHLRRKWDYAKDDVIDVQVFIDEVASKSWFSGKPYMVECGDETITSREWLSGMWAKHQKH